MVAPRQFAIAPRLTRRGMSSATTAPPATATEAAVQRPGVLTIKFADGIRPLDLSTLWLRDICKCTQCVDPDSGQKNFATTELPDMPVVEHAEITPDGSLVLQWARDVMSEGSDTHRVVWSKEEVDAWRPKTPPPRTFLPILWNKAEYESLVDQCRISYEEWLHNDEAFASTFGMLARTGLIFVQDVPKSETEVEKIANRIGILQHTFYGSTWDVRSKPHAENVAYTSKFLGLHQDLLYHTPVPRLQFLHCLENSCEGGESLFSDGYRAAEDMKQKQRDEYNQLTTASVRFHYDKGEHYYEARRPTIQLKKGGSRVQATNWAPPFQARFGKPKLSMDGGLPTDHKSNITLWRKAAAEFQKNIEAPENMMEVKLRPGECVIFDNRRVLHGRRQFATAEGERWLKGTYISSQVYGARVRRVLHSEEGAGSEADSD